MVKDWLDKILITMFKDRSCECICEYIKIRTRLKYGEERYIRVEVSEDEQNGARIISEGTGIFK